MRIAGTRCLNVEYNDALGTYIHKYVATSASLCAPSVQHSRSRYQWKASGNPPNSISRCGIPSCIWLNFLPFQFKQSLLQSKCNVCANLYNLCMQVNA